MAREATNTKGAPKRYTPGRLYSDFSKNKQNKTDAGGEGK
jgi:hypothetical protein